MSREIKYRVWSVEDFTYDDPYSYAYYAMTQDGKVDFYCHGDYYDSCEPDKYIVEQFTGLKDKNGKEIYEGDIVKQLMYVLDGKKCTTTWVVRWNNDEFCYELHRVSGALYGDSMLSTCESKDCEVIGNIHIDPELVEGEG